MRLRRIPISAFVFLVPLTAIAGSGAIQFGDGYTGRVIVNGANPPDAAGIRFDSHDRLYTCSLLAERINILDENSGRVRQSFGTDQGIITPDDLVFGPDGSAYITSILTGAILRLAPDGSVAPIAVLAPGVDGIAMSPDGRLFVSQFLFSDGVYEVDPLGVNPPRLIVSGIPGMEASDVGPDGALYVALFFTGQVARIDVDSGATTIVAADLATPIAVKFNRHGQMFVVENDSGNVFRVNPVNGHKQHVATTRPGADNMAFDSHGRLFVSNSRDASIVEVLPSGRARTVVHDGLIPASGVAMTGSGLATNLQVITLSALRTYSPWTGRLRDVAVQSFSDPTAAVSAPFSLGNIGSDLVVTSWVANLVQIWDPAAKKIVALYPDFVVPISGIGFQGDLVVAELGTGSVVRRVLGSMDKTVLAEGLYVPTGLATDGSNLWVSDWASGVVWQIAANGERLNPAVPVAFGLAAPEGIAITPDGDLLVVETGAQRLTRVDLQSGQTSTVARNLPVGVMAPPGAPPTWLLSGVASDGYGGIYVGLDKSGGVLKVVKARDRDNLLPDLADDDGDCSASGW